MYNWIGTYGATSCYLDNKSVRMVVMYFGNGVYRGKIRGKLNVNSGDIPGFHMAKYWCQSQYESWVDNQVNTGHNEVS